jgi:hypothetical protein
LDHLNNCWEPQLFSAETAAWSLKNSIPRNLFQCWLILGSTIKCNFFNKR